MISGLKVDRSDSAETFREHHILVQYWGRTRSQGGGDSAARVRFGKFNFPSNLKLLSEYQIDNTKVWQRSENNDSAELYENFRWMLDGYLGDFTYHLGSGVMSTIPDKRYEDGFFLGVGRSLQRCILTYTFSIFNTTTSTSAVQSSASLANFSFFNLRERCPQSYTPCQFSSVAPNHRNDQSFQSASLPIEHLFQPLTSSPHRQPVPG
jgi:hypothetical protein